MQIISEFSSVSPNESYHGSILTLQDALLVLEATRLNILPKVKRRLNDAERKNINAGSVFAWNETECGMKRWTDGKTWSASKVKGPFLTYQEYDVNRNVKANGLIKQSFSLTTKQNEKFHLIAYYSSSDGGKPPTGAKIPSQDSLFAKLSFDPNIYSNDVLHFNSPDSRTGPMMPQQVQQIPMQQVAYQQPIDRHLPGIPVYHPVPTTYYCHPSMVPYQYLSAVPIPQAYQLPQQSVYLQPIGPHGYSYQEGQHPNAAHEHSGVHLTQGISQNRSLSITSIPPGALPSHHPSAPPAYLNHEAQSPAFTYGVKRVESLSSLPSPKSSNHTSPALGNHSDVRPVMGPSKSYTKPVRLPSAQELLQPAELPYIRMPGMISKLREPKVFSV